MLVDFDTLVALQKFHNSTIMVENMGSFYQVELRTPDGDVFCRVYHGSTEAATLEYVNQWWNKPLKGSIVDTRGVCLGGPRTGELLNRPPYARRPQPGYKLSLGAFLAIVDANVYIPTDNKLHVTILKSDGSGTPIPAWGGTEMRITGPDWIEVTPEVEENQEYRKFWNPVTHTYVVEFVYSNLFDLRSKVPDAVLPPDGVYTLKIPYRERDAHLQFNANLNERIEMWTEKGEAYGNAQGGDIGVCRMTVLCDEYPEIWP